MKARGVLMYPVSPPFLEPSPIDCIQPSSPLEEYAFFTPMIPETDPIQLIKPDFNKVLHTVFRKESLSIRRVWYFNVSNS